MLQKCILDVVHLSIHTPSIPLLRVVLHPNPLPPPSACWYVIFHPSKSVIQGISFGQSPQHIPRNMYTYLNLDGWSGILSIVRGIGVKMFYSSGGGVGFPTPLELQCKCT